MMTVAAMLTLFVAVAAALIARSRFRTLLFLGITALILAGVGFALPFTLPNDFFVRHPDLMNTPLHPYRAVGYGGVSLIFGSGILLGLLFRFVSRYFSRPKSNDKVASE